MKHLNSILLAVLCFLGLVAIRGFEHILFYDPYLVFFQNDYLYIDSPRREVAKLILFTTLRFTLNTALSLMLIYLIFKDKSIVKFASLLYGLAYMILISAFMYFVINPRQEDYYIFFNLRRFLIQPVLLLLFIPAFYYHKLKR